jgi:hypothetical protein
MYYVKHLLQDRKKLKQSSTLLTVLTVIKWRVSTQPSGTPRVFPQVKKTLGERREEFRMDTTAVTT